MLVITGRASCPLGTAVIRGAATDDHCGRGARRQPDMCRLQEPIRPDQREKRRHAPIAPDRREQGTRSNDYRCVVLPCFTFNVISRIATRFACNE